MPHATLKLIPGVDQNRTLALNESAISVTNLVRFVPDKQGIGLVQKLGGWTKYYQSNLGSTIRALWAWEDTNAVRYLGGGNQTSYFTITNVSGDGTTVTVTFTGTHDFSANDPIAVAGVNPSGYNGSYTVSAATSNTVSFASSVTTAYVSGGLLYPSDNLYAIYNNVRQILTPRSDSGSYSVSVDTVSGSPDCVVAATGSNVNNFDTVDIITQISVGGVVLFGNYSATFVDANNFLVVAHDALGAPLAASSTVTNGGAVPSFSFSSGQSYVDVTLADHGYITGDTFPILVPLTVAGITLYGNYSVVSVSSSSVFRIIANNKASSTTTASLNGGNAKFTFYRNPLPLPTGTGYGVGGYGIGGYGNGVAPTAVYGNPIVSSDWTLDNWGQIFISCPVYQISTDEGGQVYQWDPTTGAAYASIITNAPIINDGVFVAMPQQQLIAWGSTFTGIQDPLLVRWSDVGDYAVWAATPTNQAGSYRIPKGSRIVSGIQGPQQGLIWTDLAIWAMQYVGPPYVYQFNEIGTGCGLIARKAAAAMNNVVYWMGQSQFYKLAGSGIEIIPCPIWDVIFQDLDTNNLDKIRIAPNSRFGEISWYYPTKSNGGEINAYVKYNVVLNQWDFGTLGRTAWINESVLGPPIGASTNYWIYQHETSSDADGAPMDSYFTTGYFAMTDGENKIFVDQVWPDMKWGYYNGVQSANVSLTFKVTDYPGTIPKTFGPYSMTQNTTYLTPRFRGRLVSFTIGSNDLGSFWRVGAMRYRLEQDGKF